MELLSDDYYSDALEGKRGYRRKSRKSKPNAEEDADGSETEEDDVEGKSGAIQREAVKAETECHNFVIVGATLGSLLIVASFMMCILSYRLYKVRKMA